MPFPASILEDAGRSSYRLCHLYYLMTFPGLFKEQILPEWLRSISLSFLVDSMSKQRGANEVRITLKRDPFGILPGEACAPGEKVLYVQDFQSGTATGWRDLEYQAQGWSIGEHPNEAGNKVAIATSTERIHSELTTLTLPENAVWRLHFRADGQRTVVLNWRLQADQSRYLVSFGPSESGVSRQPDDIQLGKAKALKANAWHFAEISTYQGHTEVWADGVSLMKFTDPNPLTLGTVDLVMVVWPGDDNSVIGYFDNIIVCELSAPFTSIQPPVSMTSP